MDAEYTGHRAHHCAAYKPQVTGHARWDTHTHTNLDKHTVYTLSAHEESLTHSLSQRHTCSHTFSSLQHLTPAALLLTDIFSPFRLSVSVFLAA